ncbi:nuclear fragile X mental retardation protein interacting protein 1 [Desmophyllum pertusum]|uniref:Nuclear fragile X mental retardation protein interacting protein 1 n=1 Tax=Desmophyllum pertusum TaxID=174260 RepID=A0A9X0CEV3_9CNID|nr:nuclear fragile X mental retardation protein interacting protein 1 [Desmophyllum pertusum]
MNGFTGNMMGPTPSFFGRPPNPSLGFPPRLPMNSFASYPGAQFMPGIWPNVNSLRPQFHHHVVHPPQGNHSSQQQRPQVTNVQGQTTEYSCAACQKEFSSKETLNAHLGAHVQCTYEGCTFKAGRKILKLHWIQTHETGKMRIKLNTPGEIAKWKEERKRFAINNKSGGAVFPPLAL